MSTTMIIRIDDLKKERVSQLAKREGKSVSTLLRELIDSYLKERDVSEYIDDLWKKIGQRMKTNGIDSEDKIDKLIHKVRKDRRR
ncbi:MAG: ribbon-helix-helix protein, CopG family [Candidatus Ozemobacteraceae bacterium]